GEAGRRGRAWSGLSGANRRPFAYKASALPAELGRRARAAGRANRLPARPTARDDGPRRSRRGPVGQPCASATAWGSAFGSPQLPSQRTPSIVIVGVPKPPDCGFASASSCVTRLVAVATQSPYVSTAVRSEEHTSELQS